MGGCNCLEKRTEEDNEIKNTDSKNLNNSEPEIYNTFNQNEYENVLLNEKNNQDDKEEENTNLGSNIINENEQQSNKFNNTTLELINEVRKNPQNYSKKILDNMKYILEENGKKIFKRKVKVLLNRGEEAFKEAASILEKTTPMNELVMKPQIVIPLPENEDEMNDNIMLRNKVNRIREDHNINVYFKNMIKNPEIAVLLLIVDDSSTNPGKKRNAILNPEFKKIGIDSRFIGSLFISHFSFSK